MRVGVLTGWDTWVSLLRVSFHWRGVQRERKRGVGLNRGYMRCIHKYIEKTPCSSRSEHEIERPDCFFRQGWGWMINLSSGNALAFRLKEENYIDIRCFSLVSVQSRLTLLTQVASFFLLVSKISSSQTPTKDHWLFIKLFKSACLLLLILRSAEKRCV